MAASKNTTGNLLLGTLIHYVLRALAPREEDHAITDVLIRPRDPTVSF
jgi:hypothetical protein